MGVIQEIFDKRIDLSDGSHADTVFVGKQEPKFGEYGEKSALIPRTYHGGHVDHTYRKPYLQTTDSEDKIGREMCYELGTKVPCSTMDSRGMKKIKDSKVKELRTKYGSI